MAMRSGRLEQVFGTRVEQITAAHVLAVVTNCVAESFDLDFKEALYSRSDAGKRSLATDIAAMANTAGGVILIGVRENGRAQAVDVVPVELSDDEVGRMRQVVGSLVAPLPAFDVFLVPDQHTATSAVPGSGFVVLAVPPSPSGPHAVLVNEALRYPRRNGATTYYLSESEVAQAYQARSSGLAARRDRLDEVWRAGLERLDIDGKVWLATALVPDSSGGAPIDRAAYQRFQRWWTDRDPHIVCRELRCRRTDVDMGLFHGDGGSGDKADWLSVDLHADGAGFFASVVGVARGSDGSRTDIVTTQDELLCVAVLTGLLRLAEHARDDAAASGTALLRATVHGIDPMQPACLGYDRGMFPATYGRTARTSSLMPAASAAPLDGLAVPGPELVSAAAVLLNQLGQAFGTPELSMITQTGEVRSKYFGRAWKSKMLSWAERAGITVTDEVVS